MRFCERFEVKVRLSCEEDGTFTNLTTGLIWVWFWHAIFWQYKGFCVLGHTIYMVFLMGMEVPRARERK